MRLLLVYKKNILRVTVYFYYHYTIWLEPLPLTLAKHLRYMASTSKRPVIFLLYNDYGKQ